MSDAMSDYYADEETDMFKLVIDRAVGINNYKLAAEIAALASGPYSHCGKHKPYFAKIQKRCEELERENAKCEK
jgi:hypothetical protein